MGRAQRQRASHHASTTHTLCPPVCGPLASPLTHFPLWAGQLMEAVEVHGSDGEQAWSKGSLAASTEGPVFTQNNSLLCNGLQ